MKQHLIFKLCAVVGLFFLSTTSINAQGNTSSLVYMDNGKLTYTPYANEGQTNAVNVIPDFSHAGYKQGGVALPDVPVVTTLNALDGDNRFQIQSAIDALESAEPDANGFRGTILLKAGNYIVNGRLTIQKSGIVLRGEGQGRNGTVLHAAAKYNHTFLSLGNPSARGLDEVSGTDVRISDAYVPVGTKSFNVVDGSGFAVGDLISIKRTVNQTWINELGMDEATLCKGRPAGSCNGWTTSYYTLDHKRIITAKSGNTLTIDLPIVDVMETKYGGGTVSKATADGRAENIGVENLRIESYFKTATDELHGWSAIDINKTENSWVKKVTAQFFGYAAVRINNSNFTTVEDTACIDYKSVITGGRRYGFTINSGTGNLFIRCYTNEGRHDYATGSAVTGPNAFVDSYAADTHSDIGPHHRWATGLLFDNIRGGEMRVWNRGWSGTGHGWAGAQTLFWNLASYKSGIRVASPPGSRNWGIGNISGGPGGGHSGNGFIELRNQPVTTPRSIYLQQLEDRLGTQAVDNIAIPEQKAGNIYDMLADWKGNGELGNPITKQEDEDAFITLGPLADDRTINNGRGDEIVITEMANQQKRGYLKFHLSDITQTISSAKLRLKVKSKSTDVVSNMLFSVAIDTWNDDTIIGNGAPNPVGSPIETKALPVVGEFIEFDVTTEVNTQKSGDGIISLALIAVGSNVNTYYSMNSFYVADRPQLVINNQLSVDDVATNDFKVFPNPALDQIVITSKTSIKNATVYSLLGKVMLNNPKSTENRTKLSLDLRSLSKGLYILQLEDSLGNITNKKIVKK
ncbi:MULTISPECIES: DNRLRE domain-containing protein [unclassified Polaribacter]|uniref:T9SS type A sorting domain-containing protein n=1 Tax=unclassified Polaribacter TaxID=196858 RepID=UPI001678D873|nr:MULTISPECIES: DNRLRE domain-containing protein [unclassified Polaribacter]